MARKIELTNEFFQDDADGLFQISSALPSIQSYLAQPARERLRASEDDEHTNGIPLGSWEHIEEDDPSGDQCAREQSGKQERKKNGKDRRNTEADEP